MNYMLIHDDGVNDNVNLFLSNGMDPSRRIDLYLQQNGVNCHVITAVELYEGNLDQGSFTFNFQISGDNNGAQNVTVQVYRPFSNCTTFFSPIFIINDPFSGDTFNLYGNQSYTWAHGATIPTWFQQGWAYQITIVSVSNNTCVSGALYIDNTNAVIKLSGTITNAPDLRVIIK
jgi:hypothetical protein